MKDHRGAGTEDHELTPIFHALTSRRADPTEVFHRDPLAAPFPALTPSGPGANRMMLHPVENPRPESDFRVPAHAAGLEARSRRGRVVPSDRVSGRDRSDEQATIVLGRLPRHSLHDRDSTASPRRGGRHRVLRAVDHSGVPGRSAR